LKRPSILAETLTLDVVRAELARRDLRRFVELAWPVVEPGTPFVGNWHIDKLCQQLEQVTRGETPRLLVNVPPGTSKSLIVSVFWPSWEWASDPSLRYLTASYSEALTIRDNLRVRDIIQSPWYQQHYSKTQLRTDQNAKIQFDTTAGGWRIATSVGGRGTGLHPDRIIVDDPHTAQQAISDVERQAAIEWFDRTISTRGASRHARIVVIMQRLHEQDLSGHLLARGGWTHVRWPMRYEAYHPDPLDPRTTEGELLWPSLFPDSVVTQLERNLGSYGTAGQLQQRPTPAEGGLIKRAWWRWYDPTTIPRGLSEIVISVDCALRAKETNDYTAAGVWGYRGPDVYGLKAIKGRWDYPELIRQIKDLHRWTVESFPNLTPMVLIENAGAGPDAIAELRRSMPGVMAEKPKGEKIQRVHAVLPLIEAGNVWLPGAALPDGRVNTAWKETPAWVEAFVDECAAFPMGAHDDHVDQMTQAIRRLARTTTFTAERPMPVF
jgi:predicted phage terminase large subunit-like protein